MSEEGDDLDIKIGDPDRTITGEHTYEITYRVRGAYNAFEDHDELYWNVVGNEWSGAHRVARPRSCTRPTASPQVACFTGYYGSFTPCGTGRRSTARPPTFDAGPTGLGPYQGMTVGRRRCPKGSVPEPVPILEERFSFASAFRVTPATGGISGGVARRARRRRAWR